MGKKVVLLVETLPFMCISNLKTNLMVKLSVLPIMGIVVKTKLLYLTHLTSKQENKGNLFPSTFKVEGNKVLLFS